eukprot:434926_1
MNLYITIATVNVIMIHSMENEHTYTYTDYVNCSLSNITCANSTITTPILLCLEPYICNNTYLDCANYGTCRLTCNGNKSCNNVYVNAARATPTNITCGLTYSNLMSTESICNNVSINVNTQFSEQDTYLTCMNTAIDAEPACKDIAINPYMADQNDRYGTVFINCTYDKNVQLVNNTVSCDNITLIATNIYYGVLRNVEINAFNGIVNTFLYINSVSFSVNIFGNYGYIKDSMFTVYLLNPDYNFKILNGTKEYITLQNVTLNGGLGPEWSTFSMINPLYSVIDGLTMATGTTDTSNIYNGFSFTNYGMMNISVNTMGNNAAIVNNYGVITYANFSIDYEKFTFTNYNKSSNIHFNPHGRSLDITTFGSIMGDVVINGNMYDKPPYFNAYVRVRTWNNYTGSIINANIATTGYMHLTITVNKRTVIKCSSFSSFGKQKYSLELYGIINNCTFNNHQTINIDSQPNTQITDSKFVNVSDLKVYLYGFINGTLFTGNHSLELIVDEMGMIYNTIFNVTNMNQVDVKSFGLIMNSTINTQNVNDSVNIECTSNISSKSCDNLSLYLPQKNEKNEFISHLTCNNYGCHALNVYAMDGMNDVLLNINNSCSCNDTSDKNCIAEWNIYCNNNYNSHSILNNHNKCEPKHCCGNIQHSVSKLICQSSSKNHFTLTKMDIIIICSASAAILLLCFGCFVFVYRKRLKAQSNESLLETKTQQRIQ